MVKFDISIYNWKNACKLHKDFFSEQVKFIFITTFEMRKTEKEKAKDNSVTHVLCCFLVCYVASKNKLETLFNFNFNLL